MDRYATTTRYKCPLDDAPEQRPAQRALPLYIFCGKHLLCAQLCPANQDGAAGCVDELGRIVQQIPQRWPGVPIIVRGDSGFCRDALMTWCEADEVGHLPGETLRVLIHNRLPATGVLVLPPRTYTWLSALSPQHQ